MSDPAPVDLSSAAPSARPKWPRSAGAACGAIAVGVVIALISSSPTWLRVVLTMGAGTIKLTGRNAAAAVVPLALVVAAGLIAIALVRNWARRLLAVLIAVAGVGVFIAAVRVVAGPGSSARGNSKIRQAGEVASVHLEGSPYVCLLGAVLIVAGAVAVAVTCGRWPAPARRYERAAAKASRPADDWEALERGDDPTAH